tara:strand:- start:380 stop:1387 length:1008 start_codon:yes stop_codon:yes gene_type:complete
MNKLNLLTKIAGGNPTQPIPIKDIYGESFITNNEKFLTKTHGMEANDRFDRWNAEVASEWEFTVSNNSSYWETFFELYPGSRSDAESFVRDEVWSHLEDKEPEEQEIVLRSKMREYPQFIREELEERFFNLQDLNSRKFLETTIGVARIELSNALRNKTWTLSGQKSPDVHTDEFLNAYMQGHGEDIEPDEEGILTIPRDGNRIPLSTEDSSTLSAEEQLMYHQYLRPLVSAAISPMVKRGVTRDMEAARETTKMLIDNINHPAMDNSSRINLYIEAAKNSKDPIQTTRDLIKSVGETKIKQGEFSSPKEIARWYGSQLAGIVDHMSRRMNDGGK